MVGCLLCLLIPQSHHITGHTNVTSANSYQELLTVVVTSFMLLWILLTNNLHPLNFVLRFYDKTPGNECNSLVNAYNRLCMFECI